MSVSDADAPAPARDIHIPTPVVHRLPVLLPRPHPYQPIRAIDSDAFVDLHLAHLTSDVPDSVLFPFLHGLEGDNHQQNSFFAASSGLDLGTRRTPADPNACERSREGHPAYTSRGGSPNVVKIPQYRGLVWVACDEDEYRQDPQTQDIDLDDEEDFDFEYDDEYEQGESEEDEEMAVDEAEGLMEVDVTTSALPNAGADALEGPHMHPQALRKPSASAPIAIQTGVHNHTSYFTSSSPSHHHIPHAHGAHSAHTISFPTSISSPTSLLDSPSASEEGADTTFDRRLSTSSATTSESASSSSTSASDSAHSHFGFATSASYSTTASSVGQLKDLGGDVDSSGDNDTPSPTLYSPADTDSTAQTTPCTSPTTDINIDDCIPAVQTETASPHPPVPSQTSSSTSVATASTVKNSPDASPAADCIALSEVEGVLCNDKARVNHDMMEEDVKRLTITSSFRASDMLSTDPIDGGPMFKRPGVPEGISLRNFGIQLPIYATLSDIVIYSASASPVSIRAAIALAEKFKLAIERKAAERKRKYEDAGVEVVWVHKGGLGHVLPDEERDSMKSVYMSRSKGEDTMEVEDNGLSTHARELNSNSGDRPRAYLVAYNVFVLTDPLHTIARKAPWMVSRLPDPSNLGRPQDALCLASTATYPAARNESASEPIAPTNPDGTTNKAATADHPSGSSTSILPAVDFALRERDEMRELTKVTPILSDVVYLGNASDVPLAPLKPARLRVDLKSSDLVHVKRKMSDGEISESAEAEASTSTARREEEVEEDDPFDSSDNPMGYDICIECRDPAQLPSQDQLRAAEAHLTSLDALWSARRYAQETDDSSGSPQTVPLRTPRPAPSASHVVHLSFPASPPCFAYTMWHLTPFLNFLSGLVAPRQYPPSTRPKRVLIYSSDGYTESSVLALCVLMKERGLDLPEAYLELQVEKGRSFFVYQSDIGVLKRVEAQLQKERATLAAQPSFRSSRSAAASPCPSPGRGERHDWTRSWNGGSSRSLTTTRETGASHPYARSPRNSISYPASAAHELVPSVPPLVVPSQAHAPFLRRPRAQTSPFLPPHVDHQTWFNDPRFDGSFPSRVLPFLYLGNLNHAQNAYMLHALGITHVVSVGECALVPPSNIATDDSSGGYHLVAGRGPGGHGSLWMEEREGRIKVLDIKGVCDDGIDSLQHQLAPVCEWMERARQHGGKILVHCRVGVSRSATVTIAYVMKHLKIPLVDAYLIVRSRRLNVLIQPNMRLLYNLCGWEVELARERAQGDTGRLRVELARSLNWPYLAREVHRLNEKYLH
ncbi:hypothetical protein M0805_001730 [Coniferiporia weirii]|nr:hypothetical protein M0805_001730 [Coniferiporia weirii]